MSYPNPLLIRPRDRARLEARTQPGADGCIDWTGSVCDGYGWLSIHGRKVGIHRIAWVVHHNKRVPKGKEIDHLCRNKLCVNPEHLEAVTQAENLRRMWEVRIEAKRRVDG